MDYKYKEQKPQSVVMVSYVTQNAPGESSSNAATTLYVKADDDTIHAVTLVKKQGKYTLYVNQTPE